MSNFKAGDKAILIKKNDSTDFGFEVGDVIKIIDFKTASHDYKIQKNTLIGFVDDYQLEPVEEPKIYATKIELAEPTITDNLIEFGCIKTDIKKEGNEMIESINLIDLYASKHRESIEKETKEKVEKLRKNCDVINKYNELVEQFKKDCDELYLSQFTEEEKTDIISNLLNKVDDSDKQLQRSFGTYNRYAINNNFKPIGIDDLMNNNSKQLDELNNLVETVKAHVGIAKTKEEVEEILDRYGIIKKGKLVTK